MTFDYTQARLSLALPDQTIDGPAGPVEGVLPILLRIDLSSPEALQLVCSQLGTRVLGAAIEARASAAHISEQVNRLREEVWRPFAKSPFEDRGAGRRWRRGKPTLDDATDLLTRLGRSDIQSWIEGSQAALIEFLDRLAADALTQTDLAEHETALLLGDLAVQYAWDDKERLHLGLVGELNPFDRGRFEAMSAYTNGRPGIRRCDVCHRWFVPQRAGRPARRCPGFDCAAEAEKRYQSSPERREYRRDAMRKARAMKRGPRDV